MAKGPSLDDLWNSVTPLARVFRPADLIDVPEPARRYLEHAIAPGTPFASAVRLHMHGEIKLNRWLPFTAEQVIHWGHGMIWRATVRMYGVPITGFDRLLGGEGGMRWKVLGVMPIMTASGSEITRSAAGRVMAESVWLPSALCRDDVRWTAQDEFHPNARLTVASEAAELGLSIFGAGRLQDLRLHRWGNPGGGAFRYEDFGGVAEEEASFGGYTIPTRLRIGWYLGTERFEKEGEFFRVTVDEANYR